MLPLLSPAIPLKSFRSLLFQINQARQPWTLALGLLGQFRGTARTGRFSERPFPAGSNFSAVPIFNLRF
jgi:hypothetical protein